MKAMAGFLLALVLIGQYVPVAKYDPKRDAARDVDEAIVEAQRSGRRILLEIGGEWCSWCHILDRFYEQNPKLTELRDRNYVTVKINYSEENQNTSFLSRYPAVPAYPYFFVLDSTGKLLHPQRTGELEQGQSYNLARFTKFLTDWAPASK